MNSFQLITISTPMAQSGSFLWAILGIVVFIQFLPYLAILFSKKIGSKLKWLSLFVGITGISWGVIVLLKWIESGFLATAILLFPNYLLYAIALSTTESRKSQN